MAEQLSSKDEVREAVRERYASAAASVDEGRVACCGPSEATGGSCGCGTDVPDACGGESFGSSLYSIGDRAELPDAAKLASLGCGNPTAVADLNDGETVLDLGSGGGIDVLLSARRVGPTGKAYGVDMTDEMLELALRNQREAGVENAEFLKGTIEEVPLPDDSVDVVISNCVINLSADKPAVFREAARVIRPGGRFAVTDIVADEDMDEATRADMAQWTGCIAGALTEEDFRRELRAAGLEGIEIRKTHRVHEHAWSAIIRARRPRLHRRTRFAF
jgi:arsenite methyltransferase